MINTTQTDSNILETVNGKMLVAKADGLTYMINAKRPFTGIAEYFRGNTIVAVKTFSQGLLYGELHLSETEPVWRTHIETLWQKTQEDIEDIYVYHNDKESSFLSIRGKVEGLFKSYYANGQLKVKENYFNRKPHGIFEWYHENGQLHSKQKYENGQIIDGLHEWFFDNGKLQYRETYKNGKLHGLNESFYRNGQLQNRTNYKKGKAHGISRWFNKKGKPNKPGGAWWKYKDGKFIGYDGMMIQIYGKKWCSYCYKAKQLCKREGLDFVYKELNKDFTREEFLEQFPGAKTFPQIRMDGKNIGGYTELAVKLGKTPNNTGNWIGVGTAIGAAVFAATNEPVWIAVGVAVGAALGWQKPEG